LIKTYSCFRTLFTIWANFSECRVCKL